MSFRRLASIASIGAAVAVAGAVATAFVVTSASCGDWPAEPVSDAGPGTSTSSVDASSSSTTPVPPGTTSDGGDSDSDGGDGGDQCGYPTTCPTTHGIGTVSGDTMLAGNSMTQTGTSSEWLSIRVTENDNGISGTALSLGVVLTSAPGTNYDLFLYRNAGGTSLLAECTVVAAQSNLPADQDDTAKISWGEGAVANDSDDSATITIRVQHVSGPCNAAHAWTVIATGDTGT